MKALRIPGSILALATLSILAACGGGGGGGSVTPPGGGGGGGGGGGATPTPTTAPTNSPTNAPTNSPTPSPTPSGVTVQSGWTISAEENTINSNNPDPRTFWYQSGNAPWSPTAGSTSSFTAAPNQFDGMQCQNTPEGVTATGQPAFPAGKYTQHAFVGIFDATGKEQVLPQAIGLYQPQAPTTAGSPNAPNGHPSNTYTVELYNCSYNVHTHDYSGLVHVEDTTANQGTIAPQYATLQSLLDLWGASLNMQTGLTAGANQLQGAVTIYVGTPNGNLVTSYSVFTGTPSTLALNAHTTVWIVIGTNAAGIPPFKAGNTNGLPQVIWKVVN